MIDKYAAAYRENALTDEKAAQIVDEMLAIEQAGVDLRKTMAEELAGTLPSIKVARYLQIENKVRAVLNYDLARGIPLAE